MFDQQTIIAFDAAAGVQAMAVESRFTPARAGDGHAWVVPLPGHVAPINSQSTPVCSGLCGASFLPAS